MTQCVLPLGENALNPGVMTRQRVRTTATNRPALGTIDNPQGSIDENNDNGG
jgi:hypothetical protein